MTFNELVTEIAARLNLTSSDDTTRIGRAVNRKYKEITSNLGIKHVSRRTTVQETTTQGVSTLTFDGEKVVCVFNRNLTPYKQLEEVSLDELREVQPYGAGDTPTKYAIVEMSEDTVTVELNCVPQTAFTLYADVYANASTLSGTDEPNFSESYHDILLEAVLIDECAKLEKFPASQNAERRFEKRMGELRHWVAVSTTKRIYQGKTASQFSTSAGGSGTGNSFNGAQSWEQTGLITFNRGTSAPFAVSNGSAAKVTNLDADKLDGLDSTDFFREDVAAAGSLLFVDATHDIGASGATRPRDLFLSRNSVMGGTLNVVGAVDFDSTLNVDGVATFVGNPIVANSLPVFALSETDQGSDLKKWAILAQAQNFTVGTLTDAGALNTTILSSTRAGAITVPGTLAVTGLITGRTMTHILPTTTGATNNWAPSGFPSAGGDCFIEWAGTANLALTGLAGGFSGQMVTIANEGNAGTVITLAHASGSSSAGNKFQNITSSAPTPIGVGGYATYIYGTISGTGTWILVSHEQGAWITPTFAAGDFTSGSGTWTVASGDVTVMKYRLIGKSVSVSWSLTTTTTATTPSSLRIGNGQWGGFTGTTQHGVHWYSDNGTVAVGIAIAGTTFISMFTSNTGVWANSTDNTQTHGTHTFEVV